MLGNVGHGGQEIVHVPARPELVGLDVGEVRRRRVQAPAPAGPGVTAA